MADLALQFGKRQLRKIAGKTDEQVKSEEQVRQAMSLVAAQSRLAEKILKDNAKKIEKIAKTNASVKQKLDKVKQDQDKVDEISKKIEAGGNVSKRQAKLFLDHQKRLSSMMSESGTQVEASFNDIADQYRKLVTNDKMSEEDRREMLSNFQEMLKSDQLQDQMSGQQLRATESLLKINTKSMNFDEDMNRHLGFLHNTLSDNTTDIKINDTLSSLQKQNESILLNEDKLGDLLERQTASGSSVGKQFMDSGIGKTVSGGVLDFATMGLASSLGINDFTDLAHMGSALKGLPSKIKDFGGALGKSGGALKALGSAGLVAAAGLAGWEIGKWIDKKWGKDIDEALFGWFYDKKDKEAESLSGDSALEIMKASKAGVLGDAGVLNVGESKVAVQAYNDAMESGGSKREALDAARKALQEKELKSVFGDRSLTFQEQNKKRESLKEKYKNDAERMEYATNEFLTGSKNQVSKLTDMGSSLPSQFSTTVSSDALSSSLGSAASSYDGKAIDYSKLYPDGKVPKSVTPEEAQAQYEKDYMKTKSTIKGMLKHTPNDSQLSALASFAQSVGVDKFSKSAMLKKYNAGDVAGAAEEFNNWVKAGGVVNPKLVARRQKEKGAFVAEGTDVPISPVTEGGITTTTSAKLESEGSPDLSTEAEANAKKLEQQKAVSIENIEKMRKAVQVLPAIIAASNKNVQIKPDRSHNNDDLGILSTKQVLGS